MRHIKHAYRSIARWQSIWCMLLINLVSGRINRSPWFYILAGYYGILAVMRFLLLRYQQRKGIGSDLVGEYRRSRLCGMILMMINFTLTGAVLMILYQNRGYDYPGIKA